MSLIHRCSIFTATLLFVFIPPLSAQSGSDLPESLTVQELSTLAYRQGLTQKAQVLRRAMEHLEAGEIGEAALELSRAVEHVRKEARVATSADSARNLRLAANDLLWLSTVLTRRQVPESEIMLSNVAVAAHALAHHHRLVAQASFSERAYQRAGDNLRAATLNAHAALAFSGSATKVPTTTNGATTNGARANRAGPDEADLDEAMAVATRLATGGRGRKLRDRFGTAASGLAVAIALAKDQAVWPYRRSIGRLVQIDSGAGSMVVETENGAGGPHFILASDAPVVGRQAGMPLSALAVGDVLAVWFRTDSPAVAERVVTTR